MVKQHHRAQQPQMPLFLGIFLDQSEFPRPPLVLEIGNRPAVPFESTAECLLLLHAKTNPTRAAHLCACHIKCKIISKLPCFSALEKSAASLCRWLLLSPATKPDTPPPPSLLPPLLTPAHPPILPRASELAAFACRCCPSLWPIGNQAAVARRYCRQHCGWLLPSVATKPQLSVAVVCRRQARHSCL